MEKFVIVIAESQINQSFLFLFDSYEVLLWQ